MCIQRKWPLISPSYRLLPQTGPNGLLEDVSAAYEFAQKWDAPDGLDRRVIVGGASGGKFSRCFFFVIDGLNEAAMDAES